MRSLVVVFVLAVFLVVLLSGPASAGAKVIKVRVLDPQSAAVAARKSRCCVRAKPQFSPHSPLLPKAIRPSTSERRDRIRSEYWRRALPWRPSTCHPNLNSP